MKHLETRHTKAQFERLQRQVGEEDHDGDGVEDEDDENRGERRSSVTFCGQFACLVVARVSKAEQLTPLAGTDSTGEVKSSADKKKKLFSEEVSHPSAFHVDEEVAKLTVKKKKKVKLKTLSPRMVAN